MKTFLMILGTVLFSGAMSVACDAHQDHAKHKDLNEVMKKSGRELDLDQVLSDLKMSPAPGSDHQDNLWKLETVKKGSVFSKVGLKAGDVILMKAEPKVISQEQTDESAEESELE